MSNLTYNPNVNIPYNANYNNANNSINMEFDNTGNFRPSYDTSQNSQIPQMDPRGDPRSYNQNSSNVENIRQMPMRYQYDDNDYDNIPKTRSRSRARSTSKANYNLDTFDTKPNKFDWLLFAKKIIVYTALFLIMSHIKMDELVCKFVPFLSDNQILCMTFKGVLLAIIIIIIQMLLK
jgi:hypothetical protein